MKTYKRNLSIIKERRENVLRGGINCIPSPFKRFRSEFPGIERGRYYLVSANQKIGKSKFTDYVFLLHPLIYAYNNPDKIRLHILYFSLEMSINEKLSELTCFWLYYHTQGKIRIDSKQLNSINENYPLDKDIIDILEGDEYNKFFDFIEEHVTFCEGETNPFGIYKICKNFATEHGTIHYKNINGTDIIDYYEPKDKDMYVLKIVDHVSLYTPEKGMNLMETISKASSRDNGYLRNIYGFTCIDIQQQAAAQESLDAFKADRMKPTADGLGDCKTTSRNINVMLGLYNPWRYGKKEYLGYNIDVFKDNIRFLEVVLNRSGTSGAICPLYFDGAVNIFAELPLPTNTVEVYKYEIMAKKNRSKSDETK
jgi:hypothetical protein